MIDGLDRALMVWEEENSIVTHFQMFTYILIARFSMTAWQLCGYLSFRASCHQLSLLPPHLVGVQWDGKMMDCWPCGRDHLYRRAKLLSGTMLSSSCCLMTFALCYVTQALLWNYGIGCRREGAVAEKMKPRGFQSKPRELNDKII